MLRVWEQTSVSDAATSMDDVVLIKATNLDRATAVTEARWSEVYNSTYITLIKGKQVGRNRERGLHVCQTVMRHLI